MFGIKKAITCVALAMMSMAPIAAAEDMVAMLLPEYEGKLMLAFHRGVSSQNLPSII